MPQDPLKLGRLLHANFFEVGRSGIVYSRADVLAEFSSQRQPYAVWSQDSPGLDWMMSTVPTLDTPRLWLRQFAESDFDDYAALCADAEVMRYVGDRGPLSREDTWRQLAMLLGHWALRGYGMWAVLERTSGDFVGRVGLHYPEGWPELEVAWALARPYWGRGYAFEAAAAALGIAFDTLGWARAISLIAPSNLRSIRLAERLGERFERNLVVRGHELSLYAIAREH
jgi:RimJ/RimL family protein N-acetyltransferase